ncbi:PIN domain-containing protein [Rhodococcus sp. ARC_M6]|uniref:PIN domain-containing protein n=1 Tax=Rhodococcus sp. ARC_M6 TaxID=2928852 RepID=UPI001FB41BD0|nr:PIN domain-containing protein [Rhodococcus sp. ARC_M6]MCJ0904381.1 PIN domain-containing protein [Rhodococcus sp. ARC_M6]
MIIVLDSSALSRGVRFDNSIADAKARGLRVVVPHLVVLDVANRYRAESAEMIAALSASARMYDRLGLRRDLTRFIDAAHDKADGYVQDVVDDLRQIGVEVVDPVEVSHIEIAERAISMRRPYVDKKKRDGYPATLNWLTVLDLADRNPGVEVLWVSDDARAFGDSGDASWHEDLVCELESRGLASHVRWAQEFPVFDGPAQIEESVEAEVVTPELVAPVIVATDVVAVTIATDVVAVTIATDVVAVDVVEEFAEERVVAVGPTPVERVVAAPAPAPAPAPKPVQRAARTRVAPQRIPPAPKASTGGLRNLGKVIGGRKRKMTIVEDLDEVDLFGS